ncbi:IclR family transcriptional regulator, pca regulon regulatory protein [Frankia sp. AiPs1]|uniref:IclR family transcriptional regulator n=1 Tax=Frankia sp. AiPa1 TaxID=573492 RepID=UPI00202B2FBA|nr:IclR family transcriptional regulator [Frankia sp. AiPa1]MCL9763004.1 IclR family transcriptional regulator [Frankia sp. AiPa1]
MTADGSDGASDGGASIATNQALERGLSVLSALGAQRASLGLVEISRLVGLSKSTCHRYMATLLALGFVEQDADTRRYALGPQALQLGFAALSSLELSKVAAKPLQALADETGHTANMAVLDGADIVYIERRRPARAALRIELNLQVGARLPAYCTSMGKVLLAHRDPTVVRPILDRTDLVRRGPKTVTAREQLTTVLAAVAAGGLAVNDEELAPGLRSIAAPVRDRSGQVVAAVNLSVHLGAWNASMETVVSRLEGPLRRTAAEISSRLGHLNITKGSDR